MNTKGRKKITADDVLASFNRPVDYVTLRKRWAMENKKILQAVLCDSEVQKAVLADRRSLKNHGFTHRTHFPEWAYEITYRVLDPDGRYSHEHKMSIVNLCKYLLDNFDTSEVELVLKLADEQEVPFVAQLARDLSMAPNAERS